MFKYATVVLGVASLFLLQMTMAQRDKIGNLSVELAGKEQAIDYMQDKILKLSEAEKESNKAIIELRKLANEDKCYNTIMPDYVIEQLRK